MNALQALSADVIRPLPKTLQGTVCYLCSKPTGAWGVAAPVCDVQEQEYLTLCSLCVLYATRLTEALSTILPRYIVELGTAPTADLTATLLCDEEGRLTSVSMANNIVGRMVFDARVMALTRRKPPA